LEQFEFETPGLKLVHISTKDLKDMNIGLYTGMDQTSVNVAALSCRH